MRRALAALFALGVVYACSPFDANDDGVTPKGTEKTEGTDAAVGSSSGDAQVADAGSDAADSATGDICVGTLACDRFDDGTLGGWAAVPGHYQPKEVVGTGVLESAMSANASDAKDNEDSCQIQRTLPTEKSVRIEFDFVFFGLAPADYRTHNVQFFAIFSGDESERTYLGLYLQNPDADGASVVLSESHKGDTSGEDGSIAVGSLTYGVPTHVALEVDFSKSGAVRLVSVGANGAKHTFTASGDDPTLLLGLSRQNGGTAALRANYDNFRITKIPSF